MRASCDIVGMLLVVSCAMFGQNARTLTGPGAVETSVTPVAGESWLKHIGRPFEVTGMGKTWKLGPNVAERDEAAGTQTAPSAYASQTRSLTGSDIYRLNCQACHRESGTGFVPEINSLIDPVRATSPELIIQRMKNVGMSMSRKQAAELARQAQAALMQRIHSGGQEMPSFGYLGVREVQLLVAHLGQLAGTPTGSTTQRAVRESSVQVGEHIVKSVCHICHDAAGPNPTPEQLEAGVIPPLSTLTRRTSLPELVRKVTRGAPILMGNPATPHAGRMPVLDYLTPDEAADVYLYLVLYPPQQPQTQDAMLGSLPAMTAVPPFDKGADPPAVLSLTRSGSALANTGEVRGLVLLIGVVSLISFLTASAAVFTVGCALAAGRGKSVDYAQTGKSLGFRWRAPVAVMSANNREVNPSTDEVA